MQQAEKRVASLGLFHVLTDWLISEIFSYLEEKDLVACTLVSHGFYLFAEEDNHWKKLVIKRNNTEFLFKGTWKRTALLARNQFKPFPYQRLNIRDFHSPYLYRKWYRRYVDLGPWSELKEQRIDRRSAKELTLQQFIEEYDCKHKPVIITDAIDHWPARTEWTVEKLLQRFEHHKFKTDEVDYFGKAKLYMVLSDYIAYAKQQHDEDPIYLFDDKFGEREEAKKLLEDYEIPIYFKEDYFESLAEERPPYRWFVIGPQRSGSPFHIDPYRTSAWNALLVGRKRWALYPYDEHPPGVDIDYDSDGNFDSDSPEPVKWFVDTYPHIPEDKKPIECILEAGEIMYVPSGWWHQVLNLTDTICVTQNFCNAQNFEIVCAELNFDDDDFYEEFQEKLSAVRPNIQWPTNLPTSGFRK